VRQQQYSGQYPKFGGLITELEEKYIEALGDIDCDSYIHSDLCLYILELVHGNLESKRKLRSLQQLLLDIVLAIEEIVKQSETVS
jgi:hypothetical protein